MINTLIAAEIRASASASRASRRSLEQVDAASVTRTPEPPDLSKYLMRGQRKAQSGVGLIEVLVAVLVLSIGFLGIAALQVMSLSTNNSAMARSMATIASYSIMDAMRADTANARAGSYDTTTPIKASACPAAGTTMASMQINLWCGELGKRLGAVATTTGAIQCSSTGDCTVTITFDDSRAGVGSSSSQQIVTRGML